MDAWGRSKIVKFEFKAQNALESSFKPIFIEKIRAALTPDEFTFLLSKTVNTYSLSIILKKICNKRCVQKRKPYI